MIDLNYNQSRKVNTLIKNMCCNYKDGYCMLDDDQCMQVISSQGLYCNYFKRAVLPLDEELYIELTGGEGRSNKCEICKKEFIASSYRQKVCKECSTKKRKEYLKEYLRVYRGKRHIDVNN